MASSDWVKILIKFSGKCNKCNKNIVSGDYGFWSRNTKKIEHIECHEGRTSKESKLKATGITCHICEKKVDIALNDSVLPIFKQEFICEDCINDNNSFLLYKQKFEMRVKRLLRIKT